MEERTIKLGQPDRPAAQHDTVATHNGRVRRSVSSTNEQPPLTTQGGVLGMEIMAVCLLLTSVIAIACCLRYRLRPQDIKQKLPKFRRRRSSRRARRLDDYQDAMSAGPAPVHQDCEGASPRGPGLVRPHVNSAGYTEVDLKQDRSVVISSGTEPSQYNVLGEPVDALQRSQSAPQRWRRVYDHVKTGPKSVGAMPSNGYNGKAPRATGNEYDVSVIAHDVHRVHVIGEVYDNLKDLKK